MLAKVINEETKEVSICLAPEEGRQAFIDEGFTEMEVEEYDGKMYVMGYADEARSKKYIELRKAAYPEIPEQLDMMYWDKVNGTNNWQEAIADVKTRYPKNV